jgi:hypothetical protein
MSTGGTTIPTRDRTHIRCQIIVICELSLNRLMQQENCSRAVSYGEIGFSSVAPHMHFYKV